MKYTKIVFGLCVALFLGYTAQAQKTSTATGGEATGSGGTMSYSLGQVVYSTNSGNTGSVTEGVQQPFEISIITGLNLSEISLNILTYPNPTDNFLEINIEGQKYEELQYQLFNLEGKLLQGEKITSSLTQINMNGLKPANYYLKIIQNNRTIKSFQIIKK